MIGQASGLGLSDEGNSVSRTDIINFVNVNVFNSVTSPHVLSCRKSKLCKKKLYIAALTSNAILVPRGRAPFGQHAESRPLAESNTGSPRFTDFPSLCACSESSLTNLIGSGLNLLCLQSRSNRNAVGWGRWTGPGTRFLVLTKRSAASGDENAQMPAILGDSTCAVLSNDIHGAKIPCNYYN